ncbi:hypothetical protein WA026_000100 [Henosepilachna vigintioctopunctata]|uniref:HMG box domain-containing protein n=1 Tax=Henosepilachna vigintioctopunctata TaxID=420089 RepID=A0AAW1UWI2_9CUCU
MVRKRITTKKRTKETPSKRRIVRITSNPFLNFFLSICKLNGNRAVEKIARNSAVEWRKMNYLDKTPYYLLADEAKKRKKRDSKKKQHLCNYSDWDSSISVLPSKLEYVAEKNKSDSDINNREYKRRRIDYRRKSEAVPRKKRSGSMVLTSDVEDMEDIIRETEKNLKRRGFSVNCTTSGSSFGLTTPNTDSFEVMSSVSSATLADTGRGLYRTRDFFY